MSVTTFGTDDNLEQPCAGEIVDTVTTDSPFKVTPYPPLSDGIGPRHTGFYVENGELVFYD